MICLTCHYANEDDARFCEQCGQPLNITCPACGSPATASARFCRHCGQPLFPSPSPTPVAAANALPPPHPPSLDEKLDQLQRYLPAHLADKILATRGRLAGERKLVTVLFADIAGHTALSAHVGEEALFALMDEIYELLIHLAARMEQTAAPGTIQLTEHTYKLVAGYFECDDMGLVSVKGLAGKMRGPTGCWASVAAWRVLTWRGSGASHAW